jgi:hypothetical protein
MPQVGFEPMIPVFERAKTVHALDRVATVNASGIFTLLYFLCVYVSFLLLYQLTDFYQT